MKTITEKEFEQLENSIWEQFLSKATPIEIHQSVISSNWDGNSFLRNWIKNDPKTDKATILIAYWMSAPRWKKQYLNHDDCLEKEGYGIAEFDFVEELEQRYVNGFYSSSAIEMDPRNDQDGYDWTKDYLDKVTVRDIPAVMFEKLEGQKIERPDNFDEGLPMSPIDYAQQIYDLLDEYEIED